jgi:3-methyl-2-oxobutanoate hydroxymethyltransferase
VRLKTGELAHPLKNVALINQMRFGKILFNAITNFLSI